MQIVEGKGYYNSRLFSNVKEMLAQSVSLYGRLGAFRYRSAPNSRILSCTYHELDSDICALGEAMLRIGLSDCRVALIGKNSYRWALTHLSVITGVGTSIPLDPTLSDMDLMVLLDRADVSAVFFDPEFAPLMLKCASQDTQIKYYVELNDFCSSENTVANGSYFHFDALLDLGRYPSSIFEIENQEPIALAEPVSFDEIIINPEQAAVIIYTAGMATTTKGVVLSHANIAANICSISRGFHFSAGIRLLSVLPMHHALENICSLLFGLYSGACICISDGMEHIQKNMIEHRISLLVGVPQIFEHFYKNARAAIERNGTGGAVRRLGLVSKRLLDANIDVRKFLFIPMQRAFGGRFRYAICGSATLDSEIVRFFDSVGIRIYQVYGMTETTSVVSACTEALFRPGTVGIPLAGVKIAIDNDNDGEDGEILVKGPMVMKGYFEDALMTASAIDENDWFHTGDIGRIYADGTIGIIGNIHSVIRSKHKQVVYPEQTELIISKYSIIKESFVFGDVEANGEIAINVKFVVDASFLKQAENNEAEIAKLLDQVVLEVNMQMPEHQSISHYVYSFKPLKRTTTLRIKRSSEIRALQAVLDAQNLSFSDLHRQNIDNKSM
ncbi:MAG: AMP-binding protein [Clostridiaceae bacterium]|nr:AMP-binding protein [Clostridiaceae bacterium]